jgi:perosamine synthetase
MNTLAEQTSSKLSKLIRDVAGDGYLQLHRPILRGREIQYLTDCVESTFVSSVGKYVGAFEDSICSLTGAKHAIAVSSGTVALELAVRLSGVVPGDEVLVPALSFVATAAAVVHAGCIPHFVDVDPDTWGVSADQLAQYLSTIAEPADGHLRNRVSGRRIRAIVPMHTLGHPVALEPILTFCAKHELLIVEDAAESLGSKYKSVHTGRFGKLGVYSFNGNKIVTTGAGGMVVTDDSKLADRLRHLSTTAKIHHPYRFLHDEVGYNYRMCNLQAAVGLAQMEQFGEILSLHRSIHCEYKDRVHKNDGFKLKSEPQDCESNYWLQAVILEDSGAIDSLVEVLAKDGIQCRPLWEPLNALAPYSAYPTSPTPVVLELCNRVVNIPSSNLREKE